LLDSEFLDAKIEDEGQFFSMHSACIGYVAFFCPLFFTITNQKITSLLSLCWLYAQPVLAPHQKKPAEAK